MIADSLELDTRSDGLNYIITYTFNKKDCNLNIIDKIKNKKIPLTRCKDCFDIDIPTGLTNDELVKQGAYNSKLFYTISTQDVSTDVINIKIEWEAYVMYGTINVDDKSYDFRAKTNYNILNEKTQDILNDVFKIDIKKAKFVA
jgi:hypothetical protein